MFAGRFGTVAKVIVGLCVVAAVVAVGWFAVGYFAPHPDIDLVNKYLAGYRDANLKEVQESVSGDLLDGLPTTQTVFAQRIAQSPSTRVKSWTVTHVERNTYVGQSMIDVTVVTAGRTYKARVDVFGFTEGLRVREVKDLTDANSPLNTGSTGATPGYHGGTGGMPNQAPPGMQ